MPVVLIVFDSETGSTEKMAKAVAEGARDVAGVDVVLKHVDVASLDDLLQADGIVVGSPTFYGLMSAKIKKLFDESVKLHGKLDGKVGAAFTSSGGIATGAETTILSILHAFLVHGMTVQGRAKFKHYGAAGVSVPDEKEIKDCRNLGARTAQLVLRLG